ncbi:hypothetical protein DV735_g5040, partial [Chaetothyriales sp. CBS 134920]
MGGGRLTGEEVAKHSSNDSCWVIVHGKAYDVTDFLPEHPGGSKIILKYAGKDATEEFEPIHPPDTLEKYLPKDKHLGSVDMGTVAQEEKEESPEEKARQERINNMPPLEACYNLMDFEAVARQVMKRTAWAYYSSAADDEITLRENHSAFHRIWFRPRILVDVEQVDLSTTMLGTKCDIPFYITATALGKLGHPEGEVVLTRAARKHNVIQMIPTLASCSFDEICDAREGDQVQWLQLYVNKDRKITEKIIKHAESRGCKGLFITVDAPQLGRREKDMRSKFDDAGSNVQRSAGENVDRSQGAARAISSFIDPSLSWKDIPWFLSVTKMPIILKGVQRVEDVLKAIEYGLHGVVLSNHGGRQLDFARSGVEVLAEVMPVLRRHNLQDKIEIYIDGGVRRATDIIKALCLGAKGVGIGRPFLWAMSSYGLPGVDHAMQLLKDEMVMNMRLIGATKVEDLTLDLLDVSGLTNHVVPVPGDTLGRASYEPLITPLQMIKSKFLLSSKPFSIIGPGGANAYIHGDLLADCSKVLAVAIKAPMVEAETRVIHIKDIGGDLDDETVMRFLQFAYCGDYQVPPPDIEISSEHVGAAPGPKDEKQNGSKNVDSDQSRTTDDIFAERAPQLRLEDEDHFRISFRENMARKNKKGKGFHDWADPLPVDKSSKREQLWSKFCDQALVQKDQPWQPSPNSDPISILLIEAVISGLTMDGVQTASPILPLSLLDLLSNSIIFASLVHYLPLSTIFRLSRTSHHFRNLLLSTPDTFRYVDLSKSKGAYMPLIQRLDRGGHSWQAERMDESLTEDEFYAGPLRGILAGLHRMQVLARVHALVLDGLASVTNDLLSEIVTSENYNVRLLSIRRCVNVNHPKLRQLLAYICRPSRPEGTPRLRGLYVFTDRIPQLPPIDDIGVSVGDGTPGSAQHGGKDGLVTRLESWYAANGRILSDGHKQRSAWEETLQICKGIVWFDAVPCTHMHAAMTSVLHHHPEQDELNEKPGVSTIATIALGPNGCAGCGRAPEGTPIWGKSDISDFPLLWPPPHSGRLIDAIRPPVRYDSSTGEFSQRLIVACSWSEATGGLSRMLGVWEGVPRLRNSHLPLLHKMQGQLLHLAQYRL